jgi:gamma-glutamylcyclotransferase (GGCT)/AIG2-like uncharacterized protein YtfP
LESIGGLWAKASVRGQLKKEGWGATLGYPALLLDPDGEEVDGFIFVSDSLSNHWNALDEFEGREYKRILTSVKLEDGRDLEAFIYVSMKAGAAHHKLQRSRLRWRCLRLRNRSTELCAKKQMAVLMNRVAILLIASNQMNRQPAASPPFSRLRLCLNIFILLRPRFRLMTPQASDSAGS